MHEDQRLVAGRYELRDRLGSGGMATVYRAVDQRLGRDVAVKMLPAAYAADPEFVERFRREARAAAAVSHPNVAAVYDWGHDAGTYVMVMEYVPGPTLKEVIRDRGRLGEDEALDIAAEAAAGLHAAHERGLVHRDVKPHNILLAPGGQVKVVDFGIAHAAGASSLTATNSVHGTAMYMSPEQTQLRGADRRSDIYGLGVVLYEMLVGMPPYSAGSMIEIAMQHVNAPVPDVRVARPHLHPATIAVLTRMLAKQPAGRYGDAHALEMALRQARDQLRRHASDPVVKAVEGASPMSNRPGPEARRAPDRRRGLSAAVLAVPLLIAVLAMAVLFTTQRHPLADKGRNSLKLPRATTTPTSTATPAATRARGSHPAPVVARTHTIPTATGVTVHPTHTPEAVTPPAPTATTARPAPPATPVLIGAALGPEQTVQAFYADVLHQNFSAATALWTARMQRACNPAECIDQRFARTTLARASTSLQSPPTNGQVTVSVNLVEVNDGVRRRYTGVWSLVYQGGQWLMDGERFCQEDTDAPCAGD